MGVVMPLTLLAFHAHPDDEAILTGGTLARAAAAGHRVVLVTATDGALGLTSTRYAASGLAGVRAAELRDSARQLGIARVEQLGYADSGLGPVMAPDPAGQVRFARVPSAEAAERLAAILREESADVLLTYDPNGGYGHPDHVQVHRVVHRAAQLAARRTRVLEASMNRDMMRGFMSMARAAGMEEAFDPDGPMDDGNPMGTLEADLHWQVDVAAYLPQRRAALACHASQTTDVGGMLSMPEEVFAGFFAVEHYIEPGRPAGMTRGWFMDP